MVQGNVKKGKVAKPQKNSAGLSGKMLKQMRLSNKAKKGAPVQVPRGRYRNEALDDRDLSKEIAKSSEQKVAAKLIQDGGKLKTSDILQKGKELNKELRRKLLKKKVGRVEEKLKNLEAEAEEKGLN